MQEEVASFRRRLESLVAELDGRTAPAIRERGEAVREAQRRLFEAEDEGMPQLVETLTGDWRGADVPDGLSALLAYAEKLTAEPESVEASDVERLRDAG